MEDPFLQPETILFEDHHLIIVNKPAPLLTQAPPGIPSLEAMVKEYIKAKYAKPAGVYLGVPHRLDRPVSGVMVFARNTKAAQRVHKQFEERMVKKVYWGLLDGVAHPTHGEWIDWIRKVEDESRVVRTEPNEPGAKIAKLNYRVLKLFADNTSLIELNPETGRMHQLRVQSAWRGHPVLGDSVYATSRPFGPQSGEPRERVIALHARRLEMDHPFTKERMIFTASLPAYWPEVGE